MKICNRGKARYLSLVFTSLICSLTLIGCRVNSSYYNREIDQKEGVEVVSKFYHLLGDEKYQESYQLFDESFFKVTDTQKLKSLYDFASDKLGKPEGCDLEKWKTEAIIGSDPETRYEFVCIVKRSKYPSRETITLKKVNEEIKIVRYSINSDKLLK